MSSNKAPDMKTWWAICQRILIKKGGINRLLIATISCEAYSGSLSPSLPLSLPSLTQSYENVQKVLEACDVDNDIDLFVQNYATGSERPAPICYVNYYHPTQTAPDAVKTAPPREAPNKELPPLPFEGGGGGGGGMDNGKWTYAPRNDAQSYSLLLYSCLLFQHSSQTTLWAGTASSVRYRVTLL